MTPRRYSKEEIGRVVHHWECWPGEFETATREIICQQAADLEECETLPTHYLEWTMTGKGPIEPETIQSLLSRLREQP